jgi:hypothetical protein
LALLFAIVGLSPSETKTNIEAAIKAYHTGTHTLGKAKIKITNAFGYDQFFAYIEEPGQPGWKFQFTPQHWKPEDGNYSVKIWRPGNRKPPVLAVTDNGILIPRKKPEPYYDTQNA